MTPKRKVAQMNSLPAPTPTCVYGAMYPASVLHLESQTQHTRCKIYASPEGLYVYWATPVDGWSPDWYSPIDYQATARMPRGYQAKLGWEVHTEDGLVTVTAEGGCGCGWPLKRWNPAFARQRQAWPRPGGQTVLRS